LEISYIFFVVLDCLRMSVTGGGWTTPKLKEKKKNYF